MICHLNVMVKDQMQIWKLNRFGHHSTVMTDMCTLIIAQLACAMKEIDEMM